MEASTTILKKGPFFAVGYTVDCRDDEDCIFTASILI